MNKEERINYVKDGDLGKVLLTMGLPTLTGMAVNALYNIADAYFVSGLGTSQLAAVAIILPLIHIIVGIGLTFGVGSASYISRMLGAGNRELASKTASLAIFYCFSASGTLVLSCFLFMKPLLYALGATDTIYPFARQYAFIILSGAPLSAFCITTGNITTAQGQARLTMTVMLTGALLNIFLDPIFIYTLDFKIRGAAIATVISQITTTSLYVHFLLSKQGYLEISVKKAGFDRGILFEIFQVGVAAFLYQLLASVAIGLTNNQAKVFGDDAVAAMGIVMRVMSLGAFIVFGFLKGYQPVVGINFGANNEKRVREAIHIILRWSGIFCFLFGTTVAIFSVPITSAFANGVQHVVDIASRAMRANGVVFWLFGFHIAYSSAFLAMGRGKEGGVLNVSRQGIFFLPLIVVLPKFLGLDGIIYAQPAADVLSVLLTFALVRHNKDKLPLY